MCEANSYRWFSCRKVTHPAAFRMASEPHRKRKRGGGDNGAGDNEHWTDEDSEAAEERAEHHYIMHVGDEFDKGRYTVVRQLGKGTFGRVVEMWDTASKRTVAVKVVRAVEKYVRHSHRTTPSMLQLPSGHS